MASNADSHFRPSTVDTTTTIPASQVEVESPSLSTPQARARFEFERGKSNDGTKILMVEWEDDDSTRYIEGTWTVSWEGKTAVLPAEERNLADGKGTEGRQQTHRMLFLLPPGVSIPGLVTLVLEPRDELVEKVEWRTNPLPAIFPPGFAGPAVEAGRLSKGVLHTLWAKKRLSTLQSEIANEEKLFPEGIGLAMAVQEKEWIESSFGLVPSVASPAPSSRTEGLKGLVEAPRSPGSPLSPGGSRLSEKLKGLKLQTTKPGAEGSRYPLSPDASDVAVPPVSGLEAALPGVLAAKPAQRPVDSDSTRGIAPAQPTRDSGAAGLGSIAGMMAGTDSGTGFSSASTGPSHEDEEEEDLFALPLSPRSPQMTKSPFTFAKSDTMKYLQGDQVQRVA